MILVIYCEKGIHDLQENRNIVFKLNRLFDPYTVLYTAIWKYALALNMTFSELQVRFVLIKKGEEL
jgi:hypothetical protein